MSRGTLTISEARVLIGEERQADEDAAQRLRAYVHGWVQFEDFGHYARRDEVLALLEGPYVEKIIELERLQTWPGRGTQ